LFKLLPSIVMHIYREKGHDGLVIWCDVVVAYLSKSVLSWKGYHDEDVGAAEGARGAPAGAISMVDPLDAAVTTVASLFTTEETSS